VRRAEVRRLLSGREDVADSFDAPPERGGFGATIVILR
jgi:DNA-nicking Smr family endonuclease